MDHDSPQTAESRRESEAVSNARGRIALAAQTFGKLHPDYATALNQLALLFIMQGEPDAAEPLLREALQVRRQSLGAAHPDFATNLSSLGGLLWARGDLEGAEPLLRQAVEIRSSALGVGHPKSVVSLNSLDQLLKARRAAAPASVPIVVAGVPPETIVRLGPMVRPEHRVRPGSPFPSSKVEEPAPCSSIEPIPTFEPVAPALSASIPSVGESVTEAVAARLDEVRGTFALLAEKLETAALDLKEGRPPADEVVEQSKAVSDLFRRLRLVAEAAANGLGVPAPADGFATLEAIAIALPRLGEAEEGRNVSNRKRNEALDVLNRADRLSCSSDPALSSLAALLDDSRRLREQIASAGPGAVLPEAERLVEGSHPLVALLGLVRDDDQTTDAQWAAWYDAVETGLGHAVAVAAARAKLVLRTD